MLIEQLKTKFNVNEPIFTNEIIELFIDNYSKPYIFKLIKQEEEKGNLICFNGGVYYLPKKTIIGISTITVDDVVNKKYIEYNDEVYGIYSGINLQNMFALTTQMANTIEVVTNNESMRCREIIIDGRKIVLRKSRCLINKENAKAYTILQFFSELKSYEQVSERVRDYLITYMKNNKIRKEDLLDLAKAFPSKTLKNLMYSGVLYESTQR